MTAKRHFASATERCAVDRRNDRLGAGFDHVDHFGQHRHHRRFGEFGNVGPGKEGPPIAANDNGLDRVIGHRLLDSRIKPDAHSCTERVDRRIVRNDDKDSVVDFGRDGAVGHRGSPNI